VAILASLVVAAAMAFIVVAIVDRAEETDTRQDAVEELDSFEGKLTRTHNRGVREGNALVNCWNNAATPQQAAARCESKCGACTQTANAESRRLGTTYRRSPAYVRRIYRDLYRTEQRHLDAVAKLGTVTQRAFDAVERGDVAGFFARYQDEARAMPLRVQRLEVRVDRAASRAAVKRARYLDSL
jgi:hypothetical protein